MSRVGAQGVEASGFSMSLKQAFSDPGKTSAAIALGMASMEDYSFFFM